MPKNAASVGAEGRLPVHIPMSGVRWRRGNIDQNEVAVVCQCLTPHFLAHLRMKWSWWAIFFSSPEHEVVMVSYCDRPLSVVRRRPSSVNCFTETSSPLKLLIGFWPNFTGKVPGWSPTKVVQMVLIGWISRPQGQKIGFKNAIFKNLLVWNYRYKAQSFHIWYIASSRGPLPKLFKLCPLGQNWPRPGGHNFTLNYIRKTANNFFSWTANGNFTKLSII